MNRETFVEPVVMPWWQSGLFWRTFLLLSLLISVSVGAWVLSFRAVEHEPLSRQIADQLVSIVRITRAALMHSDPELRRALLWDLDNNEGIRVYALEPTDKVESLQKNDRWYQILRMLRPQLGADTKISRKVNGVENFWISFRMVGNPDEYWLMLPSDRLQKITNWQWFWWIAVGFGFSLVGAGFISGLINKPLISLATAAKTFATGQTPERLPEDGTSEVHEANRSFNQMVKELQSLEEERTEFLGGISHDLRTPLTRMQLEVELSNLSSEEKSGMESDIRQMNGIVAQFMDYARGGVKVPEVVNISEMLEEAIADVRARFPDVLVHSSVEKGLFSLGNYSDFDRVFSNLVANAMHYGRSGNTGRVEIGVLCQKLGDEYIFEVSDRGPGIPDADKERFLRPFTRATHAKKHDGGSGLGLAIVNRIVLRYGGNVQLKDNPAGNGLVVSMTFPIQGEEEIDDAAQGASFTSDRLSGAKHNNGHL
ncbi:MAG: HAMP domain-containing protein [Burkholderiaceae bacterium]|jgi:two-component system osmolarity sensor histidine kinase EnvZ|nr:HAMP domain-containing protein [Burkholderiaceae bacterium]